MKQETPLRKGDKHFDAINAYINKQPAAPIGVKQRESDKYEHRCADPWSSWTEDENDPIHVREAAAGLVAGIGFGFGFVGILSMLFGNESLLNTAAIGCVASMLSYVWLDNDSGKDAGKK